MNRLCDSPRREAFVFVSAPLGQTFSSFRCTVVSQCINFVCLRNVRRWGYANTSHKFLALYSPWPFPLKHTSEERSSRLNRAEKILGCVWNPQIYSECPKAPGTPSLNRWNHSAFKQQIPEQHFSEIWNVISKFKIHRTTNTYTSLYRNYDWLWQGCR